MSCKARDCYMFKTCLAKHDLDSHEHHCADYRKGLMTPKKRKEKKHE